MIIIASNQHCQVIDKHDVVGVGMSSAIMDEQAEQQGAQDTVLGRTSANFRGVAVHPDSAVSAKGS